MVDVRPEPMTEERFRAYREQAVDFYAQSVERTGVPHDEAVRVAVESTDELLPLERVFKGS